MSAAISLNYFGYHPYNNPTHSERNVELPIAFWFLRQFAHEVAQVIEVGEVTPFYRSPDHTVYDPAAEEAGTIRCDAADIDYRGRHLLSISTIEHIGTADYGQTPDPARLPRVLERMLQSQTYLITFALGFNAQLDRIIRDREPIVLERTARTRWRQNTRRELESYHYGSPWYGGNGLCILTNLPGLQFEFERRSLFRVASRWKTKNWSWKNFLHATRQELADQWSSQARPSL